MKKTFFKFTLAALIVITTLASCNKETFTVDQANSNLKSASLSKKSYIVVLNDATLNVQLVGMAGYEKRNSVVKSATDKILKKAGITDGEITNVFGTALQGFAVTLNPGQINQLQKDPSVKYIEEDQVYTLEQPDVRIEGKPGGGTAPAQLIPWGITRVGGGQNYTGTNVAWIIDSGIDLDHPDLNVDVARSKDFSGSGTPDDGNGHGTHVAGTIAAINNSFGVVGVAAGAKVVSCRVLNKRGTGNFSWTIAALDYVASTGKAGDAVNMSLGPQSRYTDQAVDDAVTGTASKGIKIAMAAGNEADDAIYYSPARTNGTNIYTISAMDNTDTFASFSNYGTPVDFCEPGVNVYSCYKGGVYATMSGTSMASPHACGLLLWGGINNNGVRVKNDPDSNPDLIGIK